MKIPAAQLKCAARRSIGVGGVEQLVEVEGGGADSRLLDEDEGHHPQHTQQPHLQSILSTTHMNFHHL